MTRGRRPGFTMSAEHRVKIQNSNILNALIEHATGVREMSATQVTAGLGLLKKVLPDMSAVEHSGELSNKNTREMTDAELATVLAGSDRGSEGNDAAPLDPSQLN